MSDSMQRLAKENQRIFRCGIYHNTGNFRNRRRERVFQKWADIARSVIPAKSGMAGIRDGAARLSIANTPRMPLF